MLVEDEDTPSGCFTERSTVLSSVSIVMAIERRNTNKSVYDYSCSATSQFATICVGYGRTVRSECSLLVKRDYTCIITVIRDERKRENLAMVFSSRRLNVEWSRTLPPLAQDYYNTLPKVSLPPTCIPTRLLHRETNAPTHGVHVTPTHLKPTIKRCLSLQAEIGIIQSTKEIRPRQTHPNAAPQRLAS